MARASHLGDDVSSRSPLSICLLAPLFHPVLGGSETYTLMLALGLSKRGHKVTVVTDNRDQTVPERDVLGGVEVLRTSNYRDNLDGPGKVPWEECVFGLLRSIHALTQEHHFDLIHAQNQVCAVLGAMISQEVGCRLVCTMHEQYPALEAFGVGRSRLVFASLPYDLLIAGSDYYRAQALEFGAPSEKVRVIYHGTDLERFHPGLLGTRLRGRLRVDDQVPLIVVAGRFSPRKGQLEFVQAMARVHERVPKARACLVGSVSSSSPQYLQSVHHEIGDLHLKDVVYVVDDECRWDDMPEVYAAADVVVQPSHGEGLGLALIEAMACAKPVIGTDVSGIREIVTADNGVLVPACDPPPLAEAIIDLLLDPKRAAQMARAGLADARSRFSSERMVNEVEQAYYELSQRG